MPSASGAKGHKFESCRARQKFKSHASRAWLFLYEKNSSPITEPPCSCSGTLLRGGQARTLLPPQVILCILNFIRICGLFLEKICCAFVFFVVLKDAVFVYTNSSHIQGACIT